MYPRACDAGKSCLSQVPWLQHLGEKDEQDPPLLPLELGDSYICKMQNGLTIVRQGKPQTSMLTPNTRNSSSAVTPFPSVSQPTPTHRRGWGGDEGAMGTDTKKLCMGVPGDEPNMSEGLKREVLKPTGWNWSPGSAHWVVRTLGKLFNPHLNVHCKVETNMTCLTGLLSVWWNLLIHRKHSKYHQAADSELLLVYL